MRKQWVIWVAICLHLVWGNILIFAPTGPISLRLFVAPILGPTNIAGLIFIVAAFLAALGLMIDKHPGLRGLVLLHPQQALLVLSFMTSAVFLFSDRVIDGQYFGLARALFGLAPVLLAAIFHTVAIIDGYIGWSLRKAIRGHGD